MLYEQIVDLKNDKRMLYKQINDSMSNEQSYKNTIKTLEREKNNLQHKIEEMKQVKSETDFKNQYQISKSSSKTLSIHVNRLLFLKKKNICLYFLLKKKLIDYYK